MPDDSTFATTITSATTLAHRPGRVSIDNDLYRFKIELALDRYDELPIAARLAVELLKATEGCLISDEPSTRQTAREHLLALVRRASDLLVLLDDADQAERATVTS